MSEKIDQDIRAAASETKLVLVEYTNKEGEKKEYVLEPYSYRVKGTKTMFFGFDQTENMIKTFELAKISKVVILEKTYKPRWPVELTK